VVLLARSCQIADRFLHTSTVSQLERHLHNSDNNNLLHLYPDPQHHITLIPPPTILSPTSIVQSNPLPPKMPGPLKALFDNIRRKPDESDGRGLDAASAAKSKAKTTIGHDLQGLGLKNARFAVEAITTLASGEPMDDKELLLEHGVEMLQGLPPNSGLGAKVADGCT
jgi:hypothetical protein